MGIWSSGYLIIWLFRRPRGARSLFQSVNQSRNDFEQIADDAVVGHFEDGRVRVLVDRGDRLGALHPDQVLDGAGNAEREVQLRRDGLPGTPDLARHRK